MRFILLLILLVTSLGVWETLRHRLVRRRVPVRIHVNGSRGKSSVTRLIAAGLQAGGVRTCAKTTGSAARFIHVDGAESPVVRIGPPNIREQLGVFRRAASEGARALVLECMAVRPDLQIVCERNIVASTHGVITNVRPDHLEVQGPGLDEVARSLSGTVPRDGRLHTSEEVYAGYLGEVAARRRSGFHPTNPGDVSREELAGFAYVEFAENVSLALDVCAAVGVDRTAALRGMQGVRPDVGALGRIQADVDGRRITFVNAFAANDPDSTARIWRALDLHADPERAVVLYNNRSDRMRRARDLAPLFGGQIVAASYVLAGESTGPLADLIARRVPRDRIVDLGGRGAAEVWARTAALCRDGTTVIGVGNIGGLGMQLLAHLGHQEAMT
jgi:poly-gamma-glutamate synthase PgsB/CapB